MGGLAPGKFSCWKIFVIAVLSPLRAMGMSYKRAWALVGEINTICLIPAVERRVGGKNGGGATLTPLGLSLVEHYRKIKRRAEKVARKELFALRTQIGSEIAEQD
jgi:molybdate transport system regulatory protein